MEFLTFIIRKRNAESKQQQLKANLESKSLQRREVLEAVQCLQSHQKLFPIPIIPPIHHVIHLKKSERVNGRVSELPKH